MSRWNKAKEKIMYIEDDIIREALLALYSLISHTYDVIPEVE